MKRPNPSKANNSNKKKIRVEEINAIKKIVVRNDDDPHVFINIDCEYVKLGKFIYKTKPYDKTWNKCSDIIGLTLAQYNDVINYVFQRKILVSGFQTTTVPEIEKVSIMLSSNSTTKIVANIDDVIYHILSMLSDHILSTDQNINICYQNMPMEIAIDSMDDNVNIGKIIETTEIDFKYFDSNIIMCNKCVTINNKSVKVSITKCININIDTNNIDDDDDNDVMMTSSNIFPLIMDEKALAIIVKNTFADTFTNNDTKKYSHDGFEFTINIKITNDDRQTKFKNTYRLDVNDTRQIFIQSGTDNLVVTKENKTANKICFGVNAMASQKYDFNDYILVVDDLTNYVSENIKFLTTKQTFKYPLKSKEVKLDIKYINPESNSEVRYQNIADKTKIVFDTNKKSKFILVHNSVPTEIEKITFKLKKLSSGNFFELLFGSDDKAQIFDSKKLEKIVRMMFPKKTAKRHQMKINYNGNDCIVAVKDIVCKNEQTDKKKYTTYGLITETTEFKFEIARKNKSFTINNNTQSKLLDSPLEELEKYVGGISPELKKIIRSICLARGKLKEEFLSRGLKATKGVILYGEPGTGKTTLARNLGKLLGCEGERFRLMAGPEIFNKWVGESEANVRGIFKPAKEAWKKHGEKAPLYMVAIDEIDAMIPARSGSSGNPVRDSVVNQFLAEMDGLEQFNNLICIGITNRLELIDPAAIRPGRFGIHIKIDTPDKNGRHKIFDIHTKKLKEIGKLDEINFDKLVDLTDKFTGADIESIVEIASMFSLERLNLIDVINKETIEKHGKIKQEDFIKAIKEVSNINKKSNDYEKVAHIYS